MSDVLISSVAPAHLQASQSWWFVFSGYRLLVRNADNSVAVPLAINAGELGIPIFDHFYLGTFRGLPCYAASADTAAETPAGFLLEELRSLFGRLDEGLYEAALTAVHLVEWEKNCRFCSRCRAALTPRTDVRAKECSGCGRLEFPRVSPAIIVLIERGNTLLLARSARFPAAFFSVLAGFVEPGENLEAAGRREVMEEAGIAVTDIRYFGSQPWPFPDSLMIGFTAQYESGEIRIDGEEIVEADWYRADNLPQLPGKLSIARQLIDSFIAKNR
jgi:NAD+ diphosphatase